MFHVLSKSCCCRLQLKAYTIISQHAFCFHTGPVTFTSQIHFGTWIVQSRVSIVLYTMALKMHSAFCDYIWLTNTCNLLEEFTTTISAQLVKTESSQENSFACRNICKTHRSQTNSGGRTTSWYWSLNNVCAHNVQIFMENGTIRFCTQWHVTYVILCELTNGSWSPSRA